MPGDIDPNAIKVDGDDSFNLGLNGYTQPSKLPPGMFVMGMNLICRGGIAQTRPGSTSLFDMPEGNLQGMTFFRPLDGKASLVFAVDGLVYSSQEPFTEYAQIENIQFSANSKFVAWAACLQSTDYTPEGILYYLDQPKSVLIMQDGATRAAYWDGSSSGHIDPTPSNLELTPVGFDGTPVGLWMCWSNNRLWVSRGNQVFASDIGNPLKFTEDDYLNEARAFYLPGICTGIAEVSNNSSGGTASGFPGIICFTKDNGTFIMTSVQDRTLWLSTPGFQQLAIANTGCVAPRSIVHQYGLLWWYTAKGLINQNSALAANITSRLDVQDDQMTQVKYNISQDQSAVCGGYYDNFVLHAIPVGDKLNTRVAVLDQAPFSEGINSWPSYWTGWRPVEFARGVVRSTERIFCCSVDYDGVNRIWELFKNEKQDNGIPITSFLVTKQHFFGNRDYKKFRYAEVELSNIVGPTAVMVAAGGMRGAYQSVMTKDINAIYGQIYSSAQYGINAEWFTSSFPQTRIVKTLDGWSPSECNSECVESIERGLIDKSFSLLIAWSGIAGVSAYRIFAAGEPRAYEGACEVNETEEMRILSQDGCGAESFFSYGVPFDSYSATATYTKLDPASGDPVTATSTQVSLINQDDANRKAIATAQWYVWSQIGEV